MPVRLSPDPVRVVKYVFPTDAERAAHVITVNDIGLNGAICFQEDFQRYFIAFRVGASLNNWRIIDNEAIFQSFNNPATIVFDSSDGFVDLLVLPVVSADRQQRFFINAYISLDNIATTATARLRDVTNSVDLTTRNFVYTPNKIVDIVPLILNATIQLNLQPPAPIDVRLQAAVISGPGSATVTDTVAVLSLRLIPL